MKISLRPFLKFFKNKVFFISLIILGFITSVIIFPNVVIRPLLLNWFHRQYPGFLDFRIITLSPTKISLKDIRYTLPYFQQPLSIKSLNVSLKLQDYFLSIKAVTINDLKAAFTDASLSTFVDALSNPSSSSTKNPLQLPNFYFQNSQINYLSSQGHYTIVYNGSLNLNQNIKAQGNYSISSDLTKLSGQLSIEGNSDSVSGILKCHQLEFPMHFKIPVHGQISLRYSGENLDFKGQLQDITQKLKMTSHGHYIVDKNIFLSTLHFDVENIHDVIKEAKINVETIKHLKGKLHLEANTTFSNGSFKSPGQLYLKDGYYKNDHIEAKNIETKIHFTDWLNFVTLPHQKLKIQSLTLGLPFENIETYFQLNPDFSVSIEKMTSNFQGGNITISPFKLSFPYTNFSVDIILQNILAQKLVTLADVQGLTITGTIDGKLSTSFKDNDYTISKDSFVQMNSHQGKILYRPKSSESLPHKIKYLKGDEKPMDLVYLALWNFHYTYLKVNIEKPLQAELIASISLKGYNPDMFKGHPFDFNIKAKGGLIQLIEQTFNKLAES